VGAILAPIVAGADSLTLVALLVALQASGTAPSEGQIKGLLVERFTRFIEWPPGALPEGSPFVVCVLGTGQVADELARMSRGRQFKERRTDVRRLRPQDDLGRCHLLYIAPSEAPRLRQILAAVANKPVLTIGDTPGFAVSGVPINFYYEGEFVRFEINLSAVGRSKLKFSFKLLRLGRLVGLPPPRPGQTGRPY
jgi:YfiR/HmsC-like